MLNKFSVMSQNIFKVLVIFLIVGLLGVFLYVKYSKPKIAYIVIQEVFNDFELKKDLEKKFESVKNTRQKIVDSLRIDLTLLSKKIQGAISTKEENETFERKKLEFNQRIQTFTEDNAQMTKQYDQEIITQLNQYVRDYGKLNNYDMIYGNNSDGSLMYGKAEFNITKEVSLFINSRYKGIN